MNHRPTLSLLGFAAGLCMAGAAHSATIVGGSALLSAADANQLEAWLGDGPLLLTNIFTKQSGDDSYDFHAAADGMGRTFAVMSATEGNSGGTALIGGYNPQSWISDAAGYVSTPDPADQTAFIFNLTTVTRHDQASAAQTVGLGSYGPTFGGGHDLYVDSSLASGYSFLATYSSSGNYGTSIVDGSGHDGNMSIAGLEVFTISAVPEPGSWLMMALGLAGLVAARRMPRRSA